MNLSFLNQENFTSTYWFLFLKNSNERIYVKLCQFLHSILFVKMCKIFSPHIPYRIGTCNRSVPLEICAQQIQATFTGIPC